MIPTLSLFQVRVSKFAILLGDALAFAVAFALATLINVALDPSGSIAIWFSTQDLQRYAAWAGLLVLAVFRSILALPRAAASFSAACSRTVPAPERLACGLTNRS